MSSDEFAERLAAPTPAPGGGAAAARVGRLACSLLRMVTGITLAKIPAGAPADDLELAARAALDLSAVFDRLEDEDIAAFASFIAAVRLPRSTPEEKSRRLEARAKAAEEATRVPLETLDAARGILGQAKSLLDLRATTPLRAESDLVAAIELGRAVLRVAELNVDANLPYLGAAEARAASDRRRKLVDEASGLYDELCERVRSS